MQKLTFTIVATLWLTAGISFSMLHATEVNKRQTKCENYKSILDDLMSDSKILKENCRSKEISHYAERVLESCDLSDKQKEAISKLIIPLN